MEPDCIPAIKPLSPRECQVIQLLISGLTQKEIAREMGISPRTVHCYLERVRGKTGKTTMISAIAFVFINGLVLISSYKRETE